MPPAVPGSGNTRTTYSYNKAQQVMHIVRPDNTEITFTYDKAGRMSRVADPRGDTTYRYDTTTGQLAQVTAPDNEALLYTYNGELLTGIQWQGPVAGQIGFTYDAKRRLSGDSVNGDAVGYEYDADDSLTRAGDLTLSYSETTGLLAATNLGGVTDNWQYNAFGEPPPTQRNTMAPISTA